MLQLEWTFRDALLDLASLKLISLIAHKNSFLEPCSTSLSHYNQNFINVVSAQTKFA